MKLIYILIPLLIIIFSDCKSQDEKSNLTDQICECVNKIDLSKDESFNISFNFYKCTRPFFEEFIREHGENKKLMREELPKFMSSMKKVCPSFEKTGLLVFSLEEDYYQNINLDSIIELTNSDCQQIMTKDWLLKDQVQGEMIYKFYDHELYAISLTYGDTAIYKAASQSKCSLEFISERSTSPFDVAVPEETDERIYFIKREDSSLIAFYKIEDNLFKKIKLEMK